MRKHSTMHTHVHARAHLRAHTHIHIHLEYDFWEEMRGHDPPLSTSIKPLEYWLRNDDWCFWSRLQANMEIDSFIEIECICNLPRISIPQTQKVKMYQLAIAFLLNRSPAHPYICTLGRQAIKRKPAPHAKRLKFINSPAPFIKGVWCSWPWHPLAIHANLEPDVAIYIMPPICQDISCHRFAKTLSCTEMYKTQCKARSLQAGTLGL